VDSAFAQGGPWPTLAPRLGYHMTTTIRIALATVHCGLRTILSREIAITS